MHNNSTIDDKKAENTKINELAFDFGFPKDVDLVLDSDGAIDALRQVRDFERLQSYVRQATPLLTAVSTRALALMSALDALNSQARAALMATEPTTSDEFIGGLYQDTVQIQDIAEAALASLKAEGVGRPGEPRLKSALVILYSLYCQQCQDNHPFKLSSSAPDGYVGKFFDFARQLFDLLGIVRSPLAIGKQIQLAIKSIKNAEEQENPEE